MYHRIAEAQSDPWSLCVTPAHFAQQLAVIARQARPVALKHVRDDVPGARSTVRSVVVTFDDGYADNLHLAKPLLESREIPATIFVATQHVAHGGTFWWDDLEALLLWPGTLPRTLRLQVDGVVREWDLGDADHYRKADARRHRRWTTNLAPPTARHALYIELWRMMQPMAEVDRRELFADVSSWARDSSTMATDAQVLSPDELQALSSGGLIEIGAHTITHPMLAALPTAAQEQEIRQSKSWLEQALGSAVTSFSYPFGSESNYTRDTVALVRGAGFERACSTRPSAVTRDSDPYQLPRLHVEDWNGDEFASRLSAWMEKQAGEID